MPFLNTPGAIFPPELSGYVASEAAQALLAHWRRCDPPIDLTAKASDIRDVIDVLNAWHDASWAAGSIIGEEGTHAPRS